MVRIDKHFRSLHRERLMEEILVQRKGSMVSNSAIYSLLPFIKLNPGVGNFLKPRTFEGTFVIPLNEAKRSQ